VRRRLAPAFLVVVAGSILAACSTSTGASHPSTTLPPLPPAVLGYVTTIGSGQSEGLGQSVIAIDLSAATQTVRDTITTGSFPAAIAISESLHTAYVANYASDTITPINLKTNKPGKAIPAGSGPAGIAITPNGKTAYVTDAGSSPIGNTVTPIDLKTGKDLTPITVGAGPEGIAITPDGTMAYVANTGAVVSGQVGAIGNTVTPIDLSTGKALAAITVGNAPEAVTVSADGTTAYVANANSQSVSPIDVASNTAGTPITVQGSPEALAVSTDGSTLYVADANGKQGNVTPIDISSGTAGQPIAVPENPTGIAITGDVAYVVCYGADNLVDVDLTSNAVSPGSSVSIGGGPYAIALTTAPAGQIPKSFLPPKKAKKKS
jgi:YVTN family beta-propeller protein